MRLTTLTCALALALSSAPAAHALPADLIPAQAPDAVFPVAGEVGFGEWGARYGNFRRGHTHEGQDVFAPAGTPLYAVRDAVVIETGGDGGRGNYIALYNADRGETYVYLHMRLPTPLRVGEHVPAGRRVGSVGCTGSCDGDHLHFEIRRGRSLTSASHDPLPFLKDLLAAG